MPVKAQIAISETLARLRLASFMVCPPYARALIGTVAIEVGRQSEIVECRENTLRSMIRTREAPSYSNSKAPNSA
jgi:hypothetical protein